MMRLALLIAALLAPLGAFAQPANTNVIGCLNATPTIAANQYGTVQCDAQGRLVTVGGATSTTVSSAGGTPTQAQSVQGIPGGVPQATTIRAAGTNRSTTVGTTASSLMAANTARQGWKIKNDSASDIWINFDTTATATAGGGNFRIAPGAYMASEPGFIETGAISVIGAAAGLLITAREH